MLKADIALGLRAGFPPSAEWLPPPVAEHLGVIRS